MELLPAGGIKVAPHHPLPQVVDSERVQTDQHACAFVHGARFPALADSKQSPFGLDHDHVGGLIDHRLALASLRIARSTEVMDYLDLVFRQRERAGWGQWPSGRRKGAQSLDETATIQFEPRKRGFHREVSSRVTDALRRSQATISRIPQPQ